jgi:hypothetical protein
VQALAPLIDSSFIVATSQFVSLSRDVTNLIARRGRGCIVPPQQTPDGE